MAIKRRRPTGTAQGAGKPDWRSFDPVAEAYERTRAPVHAAPARDLVELAAPAAGARVLDVGTGTGVAAEAAIAAVGPEGLVVGIDPSTQMLRFAHERGVRRTAAAVALDLPFRNGSFDLVLAAFVIFFFTRYDTALHDMLRVLRPGGRMGVTTWGDRFDEFSRTWREVAESFVGKELLADSVRRAVPWEERFSDPRRLQDTLRDAGLRNIRVEQRTYRTTASQEDYLAGRETSATGRFIRDLLGEASWERFRERVTKEFRERFADPIGDSNDVLLAVGTKP